MFSTVKLQFVLFIFIILLFSIVIANGNEFCDSDTEGECKAPPRSHMEASAELNKWSKYLNKINEAMAAYKPCSQSNCSCHSNVIKHDLAPFSDGITSELIQEAADKGTKYQIINGKVYRQNDCMFPARCSGIEHFLLKVASKVPDIEMIINTRDWPQISKQFSKVTPVFSFSKTKAYYDIMYPAWAFWEGGPAIKLYPQGMGRWGEHRSRLAKAAERWPWEQKEVRGFFRGSRTSAVRDPLVLLSRKHPELVDAMYTKNQAWKSDADTLQAAPAEEVSLEDHCRYRFLFNYRGVAASFRLKHLFLCGSLVFHVGSDWLEFFYPAMKPWVHYVPVPSSATQRQIKDVLEFAMENEAEARGIAERGQKFIEEHLRVKDVECYWLQLLRAYARLVRYQVTRDQTLKLIHPK